MRVTVLWFGIYRGWLFLLGSRFCWYLE